MGVGHSYELGTRLEEPHVIKGPEKTCEVRQVKSSFSFLPERRGKLREKVALSDHLRYKKKAKVYRDCIGMFYPSNR